MVGPLEHGILTREGRTPDRWRSDASQVFGRVDGGVERRRPTLVVRPVSDGRHHQQVARPRGGHIGESFSSRTSRARSTSLCSRKVNRRPAAEPHGTEAALLIHISTGVLYESCPHRCRPGSRPKLQPLGAVHRHQPHTVAPLSRIAPQRPGRHRLVLQRLDESAENDRPPSRSYCRASSATCSTLASTCSPAGRRTKPTCARCARATLATVLATGHAVALPVEFAEQQQDLAHVARFAGIDSGIENGWNRLARWWYAKQVVVVDRETARLAAWRRPTARPPATRWPSGPPAVSQSPRGRERPCRPPGGVGCRELRARPRTAASRPLQTSRNV